MNRADLEHVLRAAADVAGDGEILVIGSHAIPGSFPEDRLPDRATMSIEADIAFLDGDTGKGDRVEGAIGEGSRFHEAFGVYAQGVDLDTATLPEGWRQRAVPFPTTDSRIEAICPDVHDLVAAK